MIPIGAWQPDLPDFENPGALEAKNVIPDAAGYRPLPSLVATVGAMSARVQGAVLARGQSGAVANFAADAAKLYRWDSAGVAWDDVSRTAGGPYSTPADGGWSFAQFGDLVIAVNGVDAPQKFAIGSAATFAALDGTPPVARFVATVRDFVVMGRLSGLAQRVHWSGINNAETWASSQATQADFQDLPDGGYVMGIVGGEYGLVFQERSIKRMTYVGVPAIFQFDEIARGTGTPAEGSIARHEDTAFFLSDDGLMALDGARGLRAIGHHRVDRHFWNDVNQTYLHRISAAIDPVNKLYVVSYPGPGSDFTGGTPNRLLIYNWAADRWSRADVEMEMIHQAASQAGYTLDGLDAYLPNLDGLPFSLDNRVWTGSGRLLLAAFTTAHQIGFFNGANLAATVDTGEAQLVPGRRALLRSVRPLVDGAGASSSSVSVRAGTRNRTVDPVSFDAPAPMNASGRCPVRANGRYLRARIEVAAGADWRHIQGIDDIEASPAGFR
ncbi:MAG: hypothetical protein AB7S71_14865 [Dongiaceae bacterium]